jgi:integrase
LRARVPRRYANVERRREIWLSLHTDSLDEANRRAAAAWEEQIEGWEARRRGDTRDAEARFEAARELARRRGFRYIPADQVAKLPLEDLLQRVEAATDRRGHPIPQEADALLGAVPQPEITVSRARDLFWGLTSDRLQGKTRDQIRIWRNPRIKAVAFFIEIIGDKPLRDITGDDMLEYRAALWNRVANGEIKAASANTEMQLFSNILRTVNRMKRLGLALPLNDLTFKEGAKRTRPPFSEDWIKDRLLAPGALDGLNTQARCILLGMVNTGFRPSEGQALQPEDIRLDANIPHIHIHGQKRPLKTAHSERIIPLSGVSLEAFRECPNGFPRYFDKTGLTATLNKFLTTHGLRETPDHSVYSLRHSFEDRLLDRDVDERIRRDLMGHALKRERYGKGASLEKMAAVVKSIAL